MKRMVFYIIVCLAAVCFIAPVWATRPSDTIDRPVVETVSDKRETVTDMERETAREDMDLERSAGLPFEETQTTGSPIGVDSETEAQGTQPVTSGATSGPGDDWKDKVDGPVYAPGVIGDSTQPSESKGEKPI